MKRGKTKINLSKLYRITNTYVYFITERGPAEKSVKINAKFLNDDAKRH